MRRRYIHYMNDVQPSRAFVSQLENAMNDELRRKSRRQNILPMTLTAAASIAVIALVLFGVLPSRHNTDIVSQPKTFTSAPTLVPSAVPTAEPTDAPSPEPTSEPTAAVTYPPEDVRLEIEMGDREVFDIRSVSSVSDTDLFWVDYLVGAKDSYLIEIHQSSELNSVVVAPLRPGDAYWPITDTSNNWDTIAQLTDEKGNEVGYAERVQYYDKATNTVKEGWKHHLYDSTPPVVTEIPVPVERVQIAGEVRADNTPLRYGKNADAPAITTFDKGQLVAIGYRVDNWLYVSNEPYSMGEKEFTGWMHITEVLGANWRVRLNQVDLLAESVNLRDQPDGKIIGTLTEASQITYGGATVPGKNGDWHYVSANWFKEGGQNGYVSAEYTKLNTFRLESELELSGVISATLRRAGSEFYPVEQTIEGDKLELLLERLRSACSEFVYTPVCAEGSATITLKYADGSEVVLPISGDGCTQVRYGDVTYDLKSNEERTERFLNDGGAGLSDILSPIFDQIEFP